MNNPLFRDRARAVVHWYSGQSGLKQYEIGERLGYTSKVSFSQLVNGRKKIPSTFPKKIASLDPRINLDYLLGTSDQMLLDVTSPSPAPSPAPSLAPPEPETTEKFHDTPKKVSPAPISIPPELAVMFADMTSTIKSQQELIVSLLKDNNK